MKKETFLYKGIEIKKALSVIIKDEVFVFRLDDIRCEFPDLESATKYIDKKFSIKPKFHTLKILPKFYSPLVLGIKDFEVRYNDRNFEIDDIVTFAELSPDSTNLEVKLTGNHVHKRIKYILKDDDFEEAIKKGYCILGLGELK